MYWVQFVDLGILLVLENRFAGTASHCVRGRFWRDRCKSAQL